MVCRNEKTGTIVKDEIIKTTLNQNVSLLLADMSDPLQIKALSEKIKETKQPIDVLVSPLITNFKIRLTMLVTRQLLFNYLKVHYTLEDQKHQKGLTEILQQTLLEHTILLNCSSPFYSNQKIHVL